MQILNSEKWVLLGASRGLGSSFSSLTPVPQQVWSRKASRSWDFADKEVFDSRFEEMMEFEPTRIFYFAGGGPHGAFASKQWKDHDWSFQVNFLFPARLLHRLLVQSRGVRQLVFVGSRIAEFQADPWAASYAAGKSALRGLLESIWAEQARQSSTRLGDLDLRLVSPPYMNTDLLPRNAEPRVLGWSVSPDEVSREIFDFIQGSEKHLSIAGRD